MAPALTSPLASPTISRPSSTFDQPSRSSGLRKSTIPPVDEASSMLGTVCEAKVVDRVYNPDKRAWEVKDSSQSAQKDEKDDYETYALVVNHDFKQSSDSATPTITTTIHINSFWLKDVGKTVIGDVQGVSWTMKPLALDPHVLVAFLPKLRDHLTSLKNITNKSEDEKTKTSHLTFLIEFLDAEYAHDIGQIKSLTQHGQITFDLLWAILVPGVILYTKCAITLEPRAVRLVKAERQIHWRTRIPYWELSCRYVDMNRTSSDTQFGFAQEFLPIPEFVGAVSIRSLPTYPIEWCPKVESVKEQLSNRGKKWSTLDGTRYRYYNGIAFRFDENDKPVKVLTDGRIMVDDNMFTALDHHDMPEVNHPIPRLDDDLLLLTSPVVYGFSLADKLWLAFSVRSVKNIEWDDQPFDDLVLPNRQHELIKSLVDVHGDSSSFDDFVRGKGLGLVINLFGKPGVGKTLTVEAISDYLQRPLYAVSGGDLGVTAASVDKALTTIFKISSAWKALVLIDEADVFMEERSLHDLERNAMVAVFLRQLEYFSGIIFLTTNRVRVFDEAFQSRIHVSLPYPDLTLDAKRRIWLAFLGKVGEGHADCLTVDQMDELCQKDMNGRQIRNVVKTASALAAGRQEEIKFSHLMEVIDLMTEINHKLLQHSYSMIQAS